MKHQPNSTAVDRNVTSVRCGELISIPTPAKGGQQCKKFDYLEA